MIITKYNIKKDKKDEKEQEKKIEIDYIKIEETFKNLKLNQLIKLFKNINPKLDKDFNQIITYYYDFVNGLVDDLFINFDIDIPMLEIKISKNNIKPNDELVKEILNYYLNEIGDIFNIDIDPMKYLKEYVSENDFSFNLDEFESLKVIGDFHSEEDNLIISIYFQTTWYFKVNDDDVFTYSHLNTPTFEMIDLAFTRYKEYWDTENKLNKLFKDKSHIKEIQKNVIINPIRYYEKK